MKNDDLFPKINGETMLTHKGVFILIERSKKFESVEVFRTVNGFISTYRLNDGFESFLYKSDEEIKDHFKKMSHNNLWEIHYEIMGGKAIQKMHLLEFGSKSRMIIEEEFRKLDQ